MKLNLISSQTKVYSLSIKGEAIMNTINEKVEPNTDLRIEVDRPEGDIGSTNHTGWLDRFEDLVNFLKDIVKILAE
jgi:hypothetical protein